MKLHDARDQYGPDSYERMSIPLRQIVLTRQAIQMSQAQTVEAKIKVTEIGNKDSDFHYF